MDLSQNQIFLAIGVFIFFMIVVMVTNRKRWKQKFNQTNSIKPGFIHIATLLSMVLTVATMVILKHTILK